MSNVVVITLYYWLFVNGNMIDVHIIFCAPLSRTHWTIFFKGDKEDSLLFSVYLQ